MNNKEYEKELLDEIENLKFENNVLKVKNEYMLKNIIKLKDLKKENKFKLVCKKIKNRLIKRK